MISTKQANKFDDSLTTVDLTECDSVSQYDSKTGSWQTLGRWCEEEQTIDQLLLLDQSDSIIGNVSPEEEKYALQKKRGLSPFFSKRKSSKSSRKNGARLHSSDSDLCKGQVFALEYLLGEKIAAPVTEDAQVYEKQLTEGEAFAFSVLLGGAPAKTNKDAVKKYKKSQVKKPSPYPFNPNMSEGERFALGYLLEESVELAPVEEECAKNDLAKKEEFALSVLWGDYQGQDSVPQPKQRRGRRSIKKWVRPFKLLKSFSVPKALGI